MLTQEQTDELFVMIDLLPEMVWVRDSSTDMSESTNTIVGQYRVWDSSFLPPNATKARYCAVDPKIVAEQHYHDKINSAWYQDA